MKWRATTIKVTVQWFQISQCKKITSATLASLRQAKALVPIDLSMWARRFWKAIRVRGPDTQNNNQTNQRLLLYTSHQPNSSLHKSITMEIQMELLSFQNQITLTNQHALERRDTVMIQMASNNAQYSEFKIKYIY